MATDLQHGTEPSVTSLLKGIVEDVQDLTSKQLELFKQELQEDLANTRQAAIPMVIGLVVLLIGALLTGITLALLLEWAFRPNLPYWGAFAIVAGLVTGGGLVLFFAGQKKFQTFNPLPDRTLDALKENVECLTNPK